MKDAFQQYIETRGVNKSLFPFLQAWLYVKDYQNLMSWFENVGTFIKECEPNWVAACYTSSDLEQWLVSQACATTFIELFGIRYSGWNLKSLWWTSLFKRSLPCACWKISHKHTYLNLEIPKFLEIFTCTGTSKLIHGKCLVQLKSCKLSMQNILLWLFSVYRPY